MEYVIFHILKGISKLCWASLIAQLVKNPPAMQETLIQFLGQEVPLEKGQATHCIQDGRVEGHALIFSSENSKITTLSKQPSTGECWIPPKKDTPHPRAKEKPQQDGRRGGVTFRIKPRTNQRRSEGSNKPCMHQDPETPTETETELCLSVF